MIPKTFIFIGRSGCGKGTQADLLMKYIKEKDNEKREFFYLETGARFRDFIAGDSFSSKLSKAIYEKNVRQPDFLAVWNWAHLMVNSFTGEEHLFIDGTPRSLPEAKILDTAINFYKRENPYIIYVNVGRAWSENRLRDRARSDDDEEGIRRRLDWFESDVAPAIDYYRAHPEYKLVDVNGEQTIEEVHADIIKELNI